MKNIFVLVLIATMIACSPTRNELKTSRRHTVRENINSSAVSVADGGEGQAINSPASASPVYASNKKTITIQEHTPLVVINQSPVLPVNKEESIEQKATLAQMEMFRQIQMDKEVSFAGLKKVMQRKVYITEVKTVSDSSTSESIIVSQDTVYSSPLNVKWYSVE